MIKNILLVALGGGAGSVLRFLCQKRRIPNTQMQRNNRVLKKLSKKVLAN